MHKQSLQNLTFTKHSCLIVLIFGVFGTIQLINCSNAEYRITGSSSSNELEQNRHQSSPRGTKGRTLKHANRKTVHTVQEDDDYYQDKNGEVVIRINNVRKGKGRSHRKNSKGKGRGKAAKRNSIRKSFNRPRRQGQEEEGDELIPSPQRQGTLQSASRFGTLMKVLTESNLTDYDALVLDLPDEDTTTTTKMPVTMMTTSSPNSTNDITTTASPDIMTTTLKPAANVTTNETTETPTITTTQPTNTTVITTEMATPEPITELTTVETTTIAATTIAATTIETTTLRNNGGGGRFRNNEESDEEIDRSSNLTIIDEKQRPQVGTPDGSYSGTTLSLNPGKVYAFYGIPYAAPPIDRLRFKRPFPPEPFSGVLDVDTVKAPCYPSRHDRSSTSAANTKSEVDPNSIPVAKEDCLYLNIWLPTSVKTSGMLPVLVWIHGEGFLSGMNSEDYKTIAAFALKTGIIVVSIQYRLGAFGFLYMDSPDSPGNMGLLDQIQALQWIDKNVEYFGGNPDAVTLMGHDIGSSFVGFHLLSKITPSFFKRAVMLGGAPTQPHLFKPKAVAYKAALSFATEVGCLNTNSAKTILECLMKLDSVAIWDVQSLFHSTGNNALAFSFGPTDDGHVLDDSPVQLLQDWKGKASHLLIGSTSREGSVTLLKSVEGISANKPTFISHDKFKRIINYVFRKLSDLEISTIIHEYTNWNNPEDGFKNEFRLAEVFGDYYFTCPIRKFSDLWSARGLRTYYYVFSQQSSALNRSRWMGAVHGDEIDFMFGVPLRYTNKFTKSEVNLSNKAMKVLESFIKNGTPGIPWERYGHETPHYLNLTGSTNVTPSNFSSRGPQMQHCHFWNEVFPLLHRASPPFNVKPENILKSGSDPPYNIDEQCVITFTNCSNSNFAIYARNGQRPSNDLK